MLGWILDLVWIAYLSNNPFELNKAGTHR
eukprot:COSAG02_NODE_30501_length_550_cov_0.525499_2_plen_28_part_01